MIPKIIHYCWFGKGQMPELVLECIDSWKKFLPSYDMRLWNEDNFDINTAPKICPRGICSEKICVRK